MHALAILILLFSVLCTTGQSLDTSKSGVIWKMDNLKTIGGHAVEVLGAPRVVKTHRGKAIVFDGVRDGIFIRNNPLAGAEKFTIEAIFRPDEGGAAEQRWLHIEDSENLESRALLETRLNGTEWFLDTFLKSGDNRMPLYAENFKHPTGKWFHVALVFDGTQMQHYVNGQLELSGKIKMKRFGRGITSIGVRQNKVYWFKGAVLKARFSKTALAVTEFLKN